MKEIKSELELFRYILMGQKDFYIVPPDGKPYWVRDASIEPEKEAIYSRNGEDLYRYGAGFEGENSWKIFTAPFVKAGQIYGTRSIARDAKRSARVCITHVGESEIQGVFLGYKAELHRFDMNGVNKDPFFVSIDLEDLKDEIDN